MRGDGSWERTTPTPRQTRMNWANLMRFWTDACALRRSSTVDNVTFSAEGRDFSTFVAWSSRSGSDGPALSMAAMVDGEARALVVGESGRAPVDWLCVEPVGSGALKSRSQRADWKPLPRNGGPGLL